MHYPFATINNGSHFQTSKSLHHAKLLPDHLLPTSVGTIWAGTWLDASDGVREPEDQGSGSDARMGLDERMSSRGPPWRHNPAERWSAGRDQRREYARVFRPAATPDLRLTTPGRWSCSARQLVACTPSRA